MNVLMISLFCVPNGKLIITIKIDHLIQEKLILFQLLSIKLTEEIKN